MATVPDTTTDELAGQVLEAWGNADGRRWTLLTEADYHELRECILNGIRNAVDLDRWHRLDYAEADRIERRKRSGGTLSLWWEQFLPCPCCKQARKS